MKLAPWGEMHENFDIAKVSPMSKVEECIVQLCKEIEATIVNKKIKKIENKIVEDYVLKFMIEHNYHLSKNDGGRNH